MAPRIVAMRIGEKAPSRLVSLSDAFSAHQVARSSFDFSSEVSLVLSSNSVIRCKQPLCASPRLRRPLCTVPSSICFVTISAQYSLFGAFTWRSEVYGPCHLSSWNRIRHMQTAGHRQAACTKRQKPVFIMPSGRFFPIQKAMYLWQSYLNSRSCMPGPRTQDPPTPDLDSRRPHVRTTHLELDWNSKD